MAQRILQPGQIETLAQRSIPRVRIPERATLFATRAARLRRLAAGAALGDYLQFLAVLVDAQHAASGNLTVPAPSGTLIAQSGEHGMPPIHFSTWLNVHPWRDTLEGLCDAVAAGGEFPAGVYQSLERIRGETSARIGAQAAAMLEGQSDAFEAPLAPFFMAALQVHAAALAEHFVADDVKLLDVPGMCPLCGTLPVASLVYAQAPYAGYRYLHCALCATEWHMVRVLCSQCGASGKDIAYQTLESVAADKPQPLEDGAPAVRAETCEQCHGYRKILYQEKDPGVEPVADDLVSLSLDLLLGEHGYHRASGNPLLWLAKNPA